MPEYQGNLELLSKTSTHRTCAACQGRGFKRLELRNNNTGTGLVARVIAKLSCEVNGTETSDQVRAVTLASKS